MNFKDKTKYSYYSRQITVEIINVKSVYGICRASKFVKLLKKLRKLSN